VSGHVRVTIGRAWDTHQQNIEIEISQSEAANNILIGERSGDFFDF